MKDTIELKKSWREVSIEDYYKIKEILEDDILSGTEKDIAILAILAGVPEDDIWSINVNMLRDLLAKCKWVNEFSLREVNFKHLTIDNRKFDITVDLTSFTVAQYVDFQSLWKDTPRKDYIGALLCCFILPHGKRYNEGYDIRELADFLYKKLDIMTCQELLSFFGRSCLISIQAILLYLELMKRKQKRKKTAKSEEIIKQMSQLQKVISDGFLGSMTSQKRSASAGMMYGEKTYMSSSTQSHI